MTQAEIEMFNEYLNSDASDLGAAGADQFNPSLEYDPEAADAMYEDDMRGL